MGFLFLDKVGNIWPFSIFKFDDLRESDKLVRKLRIPENTKGFVYAVQDKESKSVVYILSAQSLSQRSALDVEWLVREVKPEAVVVQVGNAELDEIYVDNDVDGVVPTSSFGVVVRSFVDKINRENYENVAGKLVMREIFGSDFYGHALAAKRVAKEVCSSFLVLETPSACTGVSDDDDSSEVETGSKFMGLVSSLVPQKVGSVVSMTSRMFLIRNDVQSKMVKMLSSCIDVSPRQFSRSDSDPQAGVEEIQPTEDFQPPPFAQSVYSLLLDLHDIFSDLPSIGRALGCSQKMLSDVNQGKVVDSQIVSEVYTFRIAVEGLRIALNSAGRLPLTKLEKEKKVDFSELPVEDKSHALLAQALQSQAKKFKSMVAVVDAGVLGGLRRHWNTVVPHEVKDLVGDLVTDFDGDEDASSHKKKWLLTNKPVVAVGAGATAVLGASSLSKVVPASTVMKAVTFKLPATVKLMLTHMQKTMALAMSPSKVIAPALAKSSANTSVLKAAASAEKIRTVAHSIIASMEKTSFSATRTAFYEIMRKRRVQPVGILPWATFGGSIATCSALLMYGDGIEYAAESLPAAPSIANLGRGVQRLRQASQEVGQTDVNRLQKSIEAMMYRWSKVKGLNDIRVE